MHVEYMTINTGIFYDIYDSHKLLPWREMVHSFFTKYHCDPWELINYESYHKGYWLSLSVGISAVFTFGSVVSLDVKKRKLLSSLDGWNVVSLHGN